MAGSTKFYISVALAGYIWLTINTWPTVTDKYQETAFMAFKCAVWLIITGSFLILCAYVLVMLLSDLFSIVSKYLDDNL